MDLTSIGIIANPASGKDIRRLVSYATVIDNNEKVNIVKRIVLAAQAVGIDKVYYMPDTFCIGHSVTETLIKEKVLAIDTNVIDMKLTASQEDSTEAAKRMEELGVGCIVVLGGDGTSRAVAKGVTSTPLLPISTGTNNVYPQMLEGTVAGMAAAGIAQMKDIQDCCIRDKRIDVYVNNEHVDIALIDAVLSTDLYAGAKAIWDYNNLLMMAVTRCHPATIGFSAIAGCVRIIRDIDDSWMLLRFGEKGRKVKAPVAAGVLCDMTIEKIDTHSLDEMISIELNQPGIVALDGERECKVKKGNLLGLYVSRKGPIRVLPKLAIEKAMALGMYEIL
jgi:predicted polyphosphate/ATP-dependent NAD kinase